MILRPSTSIEIAFPRRMLPIFWAAIAQLLSIALTAIVVFGLRFLGYSIEVMSILVIQSMIVVAISYALAMPSWWLGIQAAFIPALLAMLSLSIAPIWFLAGFVLLVLVYGHTYKTQVPLYLSRQHVWQAVQHLLPPRSGMRVLDLGSGLGGLVQHLADARPDSHVSGVESAPLPCCLSKIRLWGCANSHIEWGDFWHTDLSGYDVVCAYLSPVPMPDLWQKVKSEMRPGTLFISYRFTIPGVMPTNVVPLHDLGQTELYAWRI